MTTEINGGNVCSHLEIKRIDTHVHYHHMLSTQIGFISRLGQMPDVEPRKNAQGIIYQAHCVSDEFLELLDWFDKSEFILKEAQMEFIDILCFTFNIGLELHITPSQLQEGLGGYHWQVKGTANKQDIHRLKFAVRRQIHSLLTELPWKTWKKYSNYRITEDIFNTTRYKYFTLVKLVMRVAGELGMNLQQVTDMHSAKTAENHARQDRGY